MNSTIEEVRPDRAIGTDDVLRLLMRNNVLSRTSVKRARENLKPADDRHPFVQLAELKLPDERKSNSVLSTDAITRMIAEACNMPYTRIDPLKIDVESVTGLVSQAYATRFQFLPIEVTPTTVTIATAEPYVREWESELAPILKRDIRRVLANPADIAKYLKEFYGVSRSLFGAATKAENDKAITLGDFEQLTELGVVGEVDANDRHIVHLVDWLLQYAFDQRASDIHLEPRRIEANVRFRIDGVLHLVHQVAPAVMAAITSRLKSLGRMDVADKRRPQDGRIKTKTPAGREVELRLSTMPTTFGEKLVLRIFDPEKLTQPFSALGFTPDDEQLWRDMTSRPTRHHPRHRSDRLGQDDDVVFRAETARATRDQRLHD